MTILQQEQVETSKVGFHSRACAFSIRETDSSQQADVQPEGLLPKAEGSHTESSLWAQPVALAFLEHRSANPCPSSHSNRFPSHQPSRQASPERPSRALSNPSLASGDGQRTQWPPAALPAPPCRHCLSSTNLLLPSLNKDHSTSYSSSDHGPAKQSPQQTLIS